jgi:hypothetical protein
VAGAGGVEGAGQGEGALAAVVDLPKAALAGAQHRQLQVAQTQPQHRLADQQA